ncbi:SMI1/KNR4 family protein [Bradyrhizobium symbiodeficiens]|uniref:SMI1/KNR4 family protein n=1 Tax=Bradyrhizobium symbiodeficiens TaxID=1404367 RepID=A0A6G9A7V8_9BRAD|nr:SMI1/KNR4 family protein [Bradyrhizobium symbiodeficiens]QIP08521.1 SMI1/KNR4 family protein [Bradyrhizobium symbiodeficiens]
MVIFEQTAPPLSELDIKRVENRLRIRLPQDLKEHYLLHNGGRPRPRFFVNDDDAYDVDQFYPMNTGPDKLSFERTYIMMVDQTPQFPRGYIPFADTTGAGFFMYSVNPESFGSIMFNQPEYYGDDERYVLFLAPSLRDFLESLTEYPDEL